MKNIRILLLLLISLLTINSCDRTDTDGDQPEDTPNTGSATFFIKKDLGCGNITVIIDGVSKQITGISTSNPSCGATGTATFELSPGTYNFKGSCSNINWAGTIKITKGGCSLMEFTGSGNSSEENGKATFWIQQDMQCGNITVNVNGQSQTITGYYTNGISSCGQSGCANFTLPAGTYPFTASCQSKTWNGTVTVTANGCSKMQLTNSGGNNNGNQTGSVMFWTKSDHGCGPITVKIASQSANITYYYTSGSPTSCGVSGCANFTLAPGNYSFAASCGSYTWSGSVTVTANGCFLMQLT